MSGTTNIVVKDRVLAGGSFDLSPLILGQYLTLRKDDTLRSDNDYYNVYKIKAYQTPNLFKMYESEIQTTPDTTEGYTDELLASNLYKNLETKSNNKDLAYIASWDGIAAVP